MARVTNKATDPNYFEDIIVNGCLIKANTIYEVVPKQPSPKDPPIYQELQSSKERYPGVGNSTSLSQKDSGFFAGSAIFNKTPYKGDFKKRTEMSDKYYKIFAEPMRTYIAEIERIRIPSDDEFFDRIYNSDAPTNYFSVTVQEGMQFNTASPIDRLRIYAAIVEGELVMKGKREIEEKEAGLKDEFDVYSKDAQFAYREINEVKSKKEETAELEMETAYTFGELLRTKKEVLVRMLNYVNIPANVDQTKAELNTIYKNKIEFNKLKFKEFTDLLEQYEIRPQELELEMELLTILKSKKGREIVEKDGSTLYFGDKMLGSNFKSAVSTLMKKENDSLMRDFISQSKSN